VLTGVIGIVIMPWRLLESANTFIFVWLNFYGGLLGAVAGVMIADYWVINHRRIDVAECYREGGRYWFTGGWNWRAVVATVAGMTIGVGGAYSGLDASGHKTGPFPVDGYIPFLKFFWDYNWVAGFILAFVLYLVLCRLWPHAATVAATAKHNEALLALGARPARSMALRELSRQEPVAEKT